MKAEIICTGTELLLGQIINSNAQIFSTGLASLGIDLFRITTVGDNKKRIEEAIEHARKMADIIILNGGLGPTEDDQTREALLRVLNKEEEVHAPTLQKIREYGMSRNLPYLKNNDKVAYVPKDATVFVNKVGSAPGSAVVVDHQVFILTPGPPHELRPMLMNDILPWLREHYGLEDAIKSRVMKLVGIGESSAEEMVRDLVGSTNPTLAPTIKKGELHFRITAKAHTTARADAMLDDMEKRFRSKLGDYVFGTDHDTLENVVGRLLIDKRLTISCAESCTGGLLASALTDVPGSSSYMHFSCLTYSDEWKERLLKVPGDILMKRGAVSVETAQAMAKGIRAMTGSDIGIATTGIAGPDGGSLEKPVGLVYVSLDFQGNQVTKKLLLSGDRQHIKELTVKRALGLVYAILNGVEV